VPSSDTPVSDKCKQLLQKVRRLQLVCFFRLTFVLSVKSCQRRVNAQVDLSYGNSSVQLLAHTMHLVH